MSRRDDVEPEPIDVPIEDAIDLHPFQPRDILSVVESYLEAAAQAGFREVRLIHGRGKGFQRARVRELLEADARVEEFFDAPPGRSGGNWNLMCHFFGLPEIDRTEKLEGWRCRISLGDETVLTNDTRWMRTPSGNASLQCRVRK